MADAASSSSSDEANGLGAITAGSVIGLAAGITGLVLPVGLVLWATYLPSPALPHGAQLILLAAALAIVGAVLFAISLLVYRLGFSRFRKSDGRFWAASLLCMCGTVGVLLVVAAIALAMLSSNTIADCIHGAPTHAFACVRSAAPLASYSGLLGFWLVWLGGLGVVVGISLTGGRYRSGWLYVGAAVYALLLLDLIAPFLGLLLPIASLTEPLLAGPLLVLIAPAAVIVGARDAHRAR
jgi:hypothetical protein